MNEQIEDKYKDTPILLIQLEKFQFSLTEKSILKHASLYSKCYGACVFQAYYGEFVQVFPGVDIDAGLYDICETIKELNNSGDKLNACAWFTKSFTFLNTKRKIDPYSKKAAKILGTALTAFHGDYRGCNIFCSGVPELLVQIGSTNSDNSPDNFIMVNDTWEDEFYELPELIKAAYARRPNTVSSHTNSI